MKKFTIAMVIIATVVIAVGIGMMAFSGAFTGNRDWAQEFDKLGGGSDTITEKTVEAPASTVKTVDISMINSRIDVVEGGDKVVVTYSENSRYKYTVSATDGKISVHEEILGSSWFRNLFSWSVKQYPVTVQIPASVKLNTLTLHTVNGRLTTDSTEAINADFETTNGDVSIAGSLFETVEASSTNGNCTANDSVIKELFLNTTNGSLNVNGGDIMKIRLKTVNGGVDAAKLPGKPTDYSIKCSSVNGSVTINGTKVNSRGDYTSLTSGTRSIDVETVNGGINIETMQK